MIRWLILLLIAGLAHGQSCFIKDPATADSLGAAATYLNTGATLVRATSAYDPNTDAIVGSGVKRPRNQVIGTTTYAMDLVEGARTNSLALGTSERFDQWTAANGLTVIADTTAAPNGETIAQTLTDPGASLSSARQAVTITNDASPIVFSLYVLKTAGGTAPTFGVTLALSGGTPVTTTARINTDTGAQQYGSNASTSIANADTTYWRVIVTVINNTSGNTTATLDVYPAAAAYGASVDDATATGSAICTFADFNRPSASATSVFAASYNSNRNCLLQSEVMGTTWAVTRASITSNSTANPLDGAVTADTLVEDGTAANTHFVSQSFTKAAAAIQFTYSTYILQSGRTWAFVQCSDTGLTNGAGIYFDVANGVKGTAVALGAGWTLDASTITAVGSWYRVTITVTTAASTTIKPEIYSATGDLLAIHNGNSAAALIVWGNQLVYGAKPKTYWATTTAGLRAADILTSTLTVSTTAGTVVAVCRPYGWSTLQDGTTTPRPLASIGTVSDCLISMNATVATAAFRRDDAGGTQQVSSASIPTPSNGVTFSVGMTWNASAITAYSSGGTTGTPDTTLTPPYAAVSGFTLGSSGVAGGSSFNGYVGEFYVGSVWPPSSMQIFANGVVP